MKKNQNYYKFLYVALIIPLNYLLFKYTTDYYRQQFPDVKIITDLYTTFVVFTSIALRQLLFNMLPALIYYWLFKERKMTEVLRLNPISMKQLLYSLFIFLLYNVISGVLILLQENILGTLNLSFVMNSQPIPTTIFSTFMFVIAGGIICPISEEFFFRGALIRGGERAGIHYSIFVSAFYFAIYHDNPYRLITLFLFGAMMGYIVYYTNSIWPTILFHVLTNSLFIISIYIKGASEYDNTYSNVSALQENILGNNFFLITALFVSCGTCWWCYKKLKEAGSDQAQSKDKQLEEKTITVKEKWIGKAVLGLSLVVATYFFIIRVFY